ncbi:MAG: hypothetical protein WCG91_03895 [Candidatus Shapirobacteria bacterium]
MEIVNSYKLWLGNHHYSDSTIRNYLVDLNKYIDSVESSKSIFSPETITSYLTSISKDENKERYSSSLNKFFQFAVDQGLTSSNPIKKLMKKNSELPSTIYDLQSALEQYQIQLVKKNFTVATIKNYINDIQQFINWSESNP